MDSENGRLKINRTLRNWMLSYIVMFSLPFLLGAFLIYQSYHQHATKEILSLQYQALTIVQNTVENMLQNAVYTCQSLSLDSHMSILESFQEVGSLSNYQNYYARELQELINIYATSNDYIDKILLYFPNTGYLMAQDRFNPLEAFQTVEQSLFHMTLEEFQSLAAREKNGLHFINGKAAYSHSVPLNGGSNPSILIVVYFNETLLHHLFASKDSLLFLESYDGILYPEPEYTLASWFPDEQKSLNLRTWLEDWKVDGRKNQNGLSALRVSSEIYPIHFYSISRSSVFRTGAILFLGLGLYLLFGSIIGVLLAAWISKRNYRPVAELLSLVAKNSKQTILPEHDDFYIIRSSYQALLEAYQDNRRTLREWQAEKTNSWMNRLFKEKNKSPTTLFQENPTWSEAMIEDAFILMSVEIIDFSKMEQLSEQNQDASEISSDIVDMSYFIVKNCLEELLNQYYTSFAGETDGKLYALINLDHETPIPTVQQHLTQCSSELQEFIRTHYGILLSINISSLHIGIEHIADCYQDLDELLLYRSYTDPSEENILSALEADPDPEKQTEHIAAKAFSSQLYSTLIHGNQVEFSQLLAHIWQQASRFHNLAVPSEETGDSLEVPWKDAFSDSNLTSSSESVSIETTIEEVSCYIQENYQDPLLSVGMIADKFQLGLSFLSRNYKEQKGIGILENINRLRLEKAKELILAGTSIKDAANEVGFYSTQPLIRIFKQIEHMTPSEYRNQHKEEI